MYILSILVSGFRSFGMPVTIEFTPGLNAIVGPSGCGKSALLDALIWGIGLESIDSSQIFSGVGEHKESKGALVEMNIVEYSANDEDLSLSRFEARDSRFSFCKVDGEILENESYEKNYAELLKNVCVVNDYESLRKLNEQSSVGMVLILDDLESLMSDEEFKLYRSALSELSMENQIIVVTNSKNISILSDFMYGVIMEQYGISKVVGMRLVE